MKNDLNTELLDMLRVDWRSKDVIGCTLRIRGGLLPTLTVHRLVLEKPIGRVIQRFELTPIGGSGVAAPTVQGAQP